MKRALRVPGSFRLETSLVTHLARCLRTGETPWGQVKLAFEFNYSAGWADVLALREDNEIVVFEAKLVRWRDALHQAYRTRCFANRSYVVLPLQTANVAVRHPEEFRRRRVGLCTLRPGHGIEVMLDVDNGAPLQPWIASQAITQLRPPDRKLVRCRPKQESKQQPKPSA